MKFKLKKLIQVFFGFSKTEVNGALVLVFLIIFLLFTPYLYRQISATNDITQYEDKRLLDSLVSFMNSGNSRIEIVADEPPTYFAFNPNTVSIEQMQRLGVPSFLAKRIDNYRLKGGQFKVKKDLLRIYDFPDTLYAALASYIELPETEPRRFKSKVEKSKKSFEVKVPTKIPLERVVERPKPFLLDVNLSDTTSLKRIRGIGTSYAKRIVAYRRLLGGYHSLNQLKEVYGMNDTLYLAIAPYFSMSDSTSLRQVSINVATFKELLAHPYIDFEQTKEILNLKSKNGKFRKPEDMFRLKLMDSSAIVKLLPYLDFR